MKTAMLAFWLVLAASSTPAYALEQKQDQQQEAGRGLEVEGRVDELTAWLKRYRAWERWYERWGNRVAHNPQDLPILERNERPEPPPWLDQECLNFLEGEGILATACELRRDWDAQPLLILKRRDSPLATSNGTADDRVVKSSFFQRMHLTGPWTLARYPAPARMYGVIGMQMSVVEVGRVTMPAIGVMLVMAPDGKGGHEWKPASTLGVGVRICDFLPPFIQKRASLHFNVAVASVYGGQGNPFLAGTSNYNFVGLSISGAKDR